MTRMKRLKKLQEDLSSAYGEEQEIWIKRNKIKIGSEVEIIFCPTAFNYGWRNYWVREMDNFIGRKGTVRKVDGSYGIMVMSLIMPVEYYFPFFVLKKV